MYNEISFYCGVFKVWCSGCLRILVLSIFFPICFAGVALAQQMPINETLGDSSSGTIYTTGPQSDEVIEAVGRVMYSSVNIYRRSSRQSPVIRRVLPGERILIIASTLDWYCVKLYNGTIGFIERSRLSTDRVFFEESVAANSMNKRLSYNINRLIKEFNDRLSSSMYLAQHRMVPSLKYVTSSQRHGVISLTLQYSGVDMNGVAIPSREVNDLSDAMARFIELLFMEMLTVKEEKYQIIIYSPEFSDQGLVENTQAEYAELVINYDDVDIDAINSKERRLLDMVGMDMAPADLFVRYPN